jgi:hypothetical protein
MFRKIIGWFCKFFKKKRKYSYEYVEDVPEIFSPDTLYILQNEGYSWKVVMQCPCGCEENIHLNLMEGQTPNWRIEINGKDNISLMPSVWRTVGCVSHFFVRNGAIEWCK